MRPGRYGPRAAAGAVFASALLLAAPAGAKAEGLSLSGSVSSSFALWEDRGSSLFPAGSSASRQGRAALDLRAEAGEASRCAAEGSLFLELGSGELSYELRELWAEWRPAEALSLRAGRQRLSFGSGFGWNPSDDLDPPRYATDPTAARTGADAAALRLDLMGLSGFPLSLSLVGIPPPSEAGLPLSRGKAGIQLYALAGALEIMLAASASDLGGGSESWLAGGWATFPLGPLVLGLEGAARKRADLYRPGPGGVPALDRDARYSAVATATLRSGDFLLIAELYWNGAAYSRDELGSILASGYEAAYAAILLALGSVGEWHGLARLAWASGDWSAALGAVADLETGAFVASASGALSFEDGAELLLEAAAPASAAFLNRDELALSGRGWSGRATVRLRF